MFSDAHEARSVREMGRVGIRNGDLLDAAQQEFGFTQQSFGGFRGVCAFH